MRQSAFGAASRWFFDRPRVINAIGKKNAAVLKAQGRILQKQARSRIKKRSGASKPGESPHSHVGTLKRFLLYKYDPSTKSVVVGPVKLGGSPVPVPGTLEDGGATAKRKNPRRVKRSVGDGGIIQVGGWRIDSQTGKRIISATSRKGKSYRQWKTTKSIIDFRGRKKFVVFAKLKSEAMVEHAEQLEEQVYGPMMLKRAKVKARPYMGPAFQEAKPRLARVWQNAIN